MWLQQRACLKWFNALSRKYFRSCRDLVVRTQCHHVKFSEDKNLCALYRRSWYSCLNPLSFCSLERFIFFSFLFINSIMNENFALWLTCWWHSGNQTCSVQIVSLYSHRVVAHGTVADMNGTYLELMRVIWQAAEASRKAFRALPSSIFTAAASWYQKFRAQAKFASSRECVAACVCVSLSACVYIHVCSVCLSNRLTPQHAV